MFQITFGAAAFLHQSSFHVAFVYYQLQKEIVSLSDIIPFETYELLLWFKPNRHKISHSLLSLPGGMGRRNRR